MDDPRRRIPRTDVLLQRDEVRAAVDVMGQRVVRGLARGAQDRARRGEIAPEDVAAELAGLLSRHRASSLSPVLNATGVVVHTNLGRAPLAAPAVEALTAASGYVDVEMELATGARSRRGAAARAALLERCPDAEEALVVNNGAAALVLATTACAGADGAEVMVSRGELIEIGAGFRLPDLILSTGASLKEVGTTNRTHLADYAEHIGTATGCVLKIHPSNFRIEGFTAEAEVAELSGLAHQHGLPLIVDIGSGLLEPEERLPDEPDFGSVLRAGADLVIASGDKLLGGPQAGIILGRASAVARLARHPLARAVRADKLTLAALEATLRADAPPVLTALRADPDRLRARAEHLAEALASDTEARIVPHEGRVGGGGGAGVPLPGWAVALPPAIAPLLRTGEPAVLPRVSADACLLDLRNVPESQDEALISAVTAAWEGLRR